MTTTLPPFVRSSETSRAAALSMYDHAPTQKELVLAAIRTYGPVSDQRIAELTGLPGDSVRPRRVALLNDGLIEQSGEGVTTAGRKCALWVAAVVQERLL